MLPLAAHASLVDKIIVDEVVTPPQSKEYDFNSDGTIDFTAHVTEGASGCCFYTGEVELLFFLFADGSFDLFNSHVNCIVTDELGEPGCDFSGTPGTPLPTEGSANFGFAILHWDVLFEPPPFEPFSLSVRVTAFAVPEPGLGWLAVLAATFIAYGAIAARGRAVRTGN